MRIGVFGCGYVGLVTGACLAEVGNDVIGVDINADKVALLNQGKMPIYEPGLESVIKNNLAAGRLRFSVSATQCVQNCDVIFIAVGTPNASDGGADLSDVKAVAKAVGDAIRDSTQGYQLIVVKSTVPAGTTRQVRQIIEECLLGNATTIDVAFNPEFLKEGAALRDFQRPDRIIIGVDSRRAEKTLRALYAPYNRNHEKLIAMDIASAELTKYAANAMLATRISFMNEMASIADRVGADIEQVRIGIGSDPRIGYAFLYAGAGFGGSCFPKDLKALSHCAQNHALDTFILDAVQTVNDNQKRLLYQKLEDYFSDKIKGKTIAIWGLAFKPETDDIRDASSRVLMQQLWHAGARVQAFDPQAMQAVEAEYDSQIKQGKLRLFEQAYAALEGADALAVVTEWKSFWSPDFRRIRKALNYPLLIDGRNIYDPALVADAGLVHCAIGRGLPAGFSAASRLSVYE